LFGDIVLITVITYEALMGNYITVDLFRNDMKFSAAHFTVFSATKRERIHGHNYYVRLKVSSIIGDNDITYDYRVERNKIKGLCKYLNEYLLLPKFCSFLSLKENDSEGIIVEFNNRSMLLLRDDVRILPLANVTSEALAKWFLDSLLKDGEHIKNNKIKKISVIISTTTGQSSQVDWRV
jgi:6-pyruvoyltetrahydropterin/6-carboxytetrahydropterin synthase